MTDLLKIYQELQEKKWVNLSHQIKEDSPHFPALPALEKKDIFTLKDSFATDLIGRPAGFFLGWSYWFMWVVTAVADIIAIVGYTELWWPDLPKAVPALVVIIALLVLNLPSVKNFGEIEFWFAMIKIVAICALIIVGAIMVATSFTTPSVVHTQVANL